MGYFRDVAKGLSWMGLLRGSTRLIAFIKLAILAHLLTPGDFGLFGIAGLILALLEVLTETGINVFLIQSEESLKKYLNTAWVISIFRGILISTFIVVSVPLVTFFFKSPESARLLYLIALAPFLRGFINPAIIKFRKELEFAKEFFLRFSTYVFDASVAIFLTLLTHSPTSLVWGIIGGVALELVISFVLITPRPRLSFKRSQVKEIFNRGKWVTLAGIFEYLFGQGDDLVVGRLLNIESLGVYQMAYKISTLPITEVADVFGKVTFPVYRKIGEDTPRLKRAFWKTTLFISLLTIPMGTIFFLFPKEVILIILGNQWISAAPVLRILSLFGMIRAISGSSSALFLALDRQEYVTLITLISILGLGISILPLVLSFGILGAGVATLIGSIVALPIVGYCLFLTLKK